MSKTACFHVLIYVEGFYGKGGDLMLKKFISTLVLICVMTCCFSFNVFAETTVDDEIALMNLYTNKSAQTSHVPVLRKFHMIVPLQENQRQQR